MRIHVTTAAEHAKLASWYRAVALDYREAAIRHAQNSVWTLLKAAEAADKRADYHDTMAQGRRPRRPEIPDITQ